MPQNHTPGGWKLEDQIRYQKTGLETTLPFAPQAGEQKAVRERFEGKYVDLGFDFSTSQPFCKDQMVKINRWPEKVVFRCDEFNNHLKIVSYGFPLRTVHSVLHHLAPLSDNQIRRSLLAVLIAVVRMNNGKGDDRSNALNYLHSLVPVYTVDGRVAADPEAMYYSLVPEQVEGLRQILSQSLRAFEHELKCTVLPDLRFPLACTRRHSCKQIHQPYATFLNALKRVVDSGVEFDCRPNGVDNDAHKFCAFQLCSQCTKEGCRAYHFVVPFEEDAELNFITIKDGKSPNQLSAEEEDGSEDDEMIQFCPKQIIQDAMESCHSDSDG